MSTNTTSFPVSYGPYAIGNSVNAPCPNLKKLIVPASTTATTTTLVPVFSTGKGFVTRAGGFCPVSPDGHTHANTRRTSDGGSTGGGGARGGGAVAAAAAAFCWAKDMRIRGAGGGSAGNSPNKAVSSDIVGIGVVRALWDT